MSSSVAPSDILSVLRGAGRPLLIRDIAVALGVTPTAVGKSSQQTSYFVRERLTGGGNYLVSPHPDLARHWPEWSVAP